MAKASKKGLTKILGLDLSTTCTGFALLDADSKALLKYGYIVPQVKGVTKLKYPKQALAKILDLSKKIVELIRQYQPDQLVIEEVNRGISRTSQKPLDALHFFVVHFIDLEFPHLIDSVYYYDSNGNKGWRTHLSLKLTEEGKAHNAHIKTFKSSRKAGKKKAKINYKHLASRYVAQTYNVNLDVDEDAKHSDICDAIALTNSYLLHVYSGS
jgi:hypothetical protein